MSSLRMLIFPLLIISFTSCKKVISESFYEPLIGAWTSNLGNSIVINESGEGWSNGAYSRKVWVQHARPKLIFAGEFNAQTNHPRTTFFIELAPTTSRDTIKFRDFIISPDQTYMKLINEDFNEEYFRRDSL